MRLLTTAQGGMFRLSHKRRITVLGLGLAATASMGWSVASDGPRGLVAGLVVPAVCIFAIGFLADMLVGMVTGIAAAVVGTVLAGRIGGTSTGSGDAVINLLPLFAPLLLLGAAAVGMLCRILSDALVDVAHRRRTTGG